MLTALLLLAALLVAMAVSTSPTPGGISRRPYLRRFSDAPGARSTISGREGIARMTSRGTR